MTYNKPEVVTLDSALRIIQGVRKPPYVYQDSLHPLMWNATIGAYEADE